MRLLRPAGAADGDLGAAFGVGVGVGPVAHHFAGEGHDVVGGGGVGEDAAGAEAGGVVRHVAFVGGGEEGEEGEEEEVEEGWGEHCGRDKGGVSLRRSWT